MNPIKEINELAEDIHKNAVEHGWWEGVRNDGEIIALIHSECSEALECLRKGTENDECDKPGLDLTNLEEELADIIIRVMDYAAAKSVDIGNAILKKHEFNALRPYKHGKKF